MIPFLDNTHPAILYPGTTWQKIENRFLMGTSDSETPGTTGGASTATLTVDNMAPHDHEAVQTSHVHTQPSHSHGIICRDNTSNYTHVSTQSGRESGQVVRHTEYSGGESTGSATPAISVSSTGRGKAFSILPPYITVNFWVRLT